MADEHRALQVEQQQHAKPAAGGDEHEGGADARLGHGHQAAEHRPSTHADHLQALYDGEKPHPLLRRCGGGDHDRRERVDEGPAAAQQRAQQMQAPGQRLGQCEARHRRGEEQRRQGRGAGLAEAVADVTDERADDQGGASADDEHFAHVLRGAAEQGEAQRQQEGRPVAQGRQHDSQPEAGEGALRKLPRHRLRLARRGRSLGRSPGWTIAVFRAARLGSALTGPPAGAVSRTVGHGRA